MLHAPAVCCQRLVGLPVAYYGLFFCAAFLNAIIVDASTFQMPSIFTTAIGIGAAVDRSMTRLASSTPDDSTRDISIDRYCFERSAATSAG